MPHGYAHWLWLLIFSSACTWAAPKIQTQAGPPPGFEDLLEPQLTFVDIYFQDRQIANTLAEYTPDQLTLLTPDEVISQLTGIRNPASILDALSQPLARNSEQACQEFIDNPDCGRLEPELVAIIFNELSFRVDIFIHPRELDDQFLALDKYLPPSSAQQLSSLHALTFSSSGEFENSPSFTLSGNSTLAFKETRLNGFWDISDQENFTINTLALQRERQGIEYEFGTFRSGRQASRIIPDQALLGLRLGSSLRTRADLDVAQGSRIFIFLNRRSRVDILRDNRLLTTQIYAAGNQQLDTSDLPSGAYSITVRIRDDVGGARDEIFFFNKSLQLPPEGEPLYFAEAGFIEQNTETDLFPRVSNDLIARIGSQQRLNDRLGLQGVLVYTGGSRLLELGLDLFADNRQLTPSLLLGNGRNYGLDLQGQWQRGNLGINLDHRRLLSRGNAGAELLGDSTRQTNATLNLRVAETTIALTARANSQGDGEAQETFGLRLFRPLLKGARFTLNSVLNSSYSDSELSLQAGLQLVFRRPRQRAQLNLQGERQPSTDNSFSQDATLNWDNITTPWGSLDSSVFANNQRDERSLGSQWQLRNRHIDGSLQLEQVDSAGQDQTRYASNLRLSAASVGRSFSWGSNSNQNAGVVIDLSGQTPGAEFEVLVDERPSGNALGGSRTLIPLNAYQSYAIRLEHRGGEFIRFGQDSQTITLYPGNVVPLRWEAQRIQVLIGQVVDQQAQPLSNWRINNIDGFASSDDSGWFQVELPHTTQVLEFNRGNQRCQLTLPPRSADEEIIVYDHPQPCLD